MCGSAIGLSCSCSSAVFQLCWTRSRSICSRMSAANCLRTMAAGAFPLRNPGNRARAWYPRVARSSASRTWSSGTVTASDAAPGSEAVLVTWISDTWEI
jgi:hypothetical protein